MNIIGNKKLFAAQQLSSKIHELYWERVAEKLTGKNGIDYERDNLEAIRINRRVEKELVYSTGSFQKALPAVMPLKTFIKGYANSGVIVYYDIDDLLSKSKIILPSLRITNASSMTATKAGSGAYYYA